MTDNKIASRDRQVQAVQERHANVGLPVTLEPGPVDFVDYLRLQRLGDVASSSSQDPPRALPG